uniref:Uncharacterized protein n=1 Tax=Solanum lycopersicum TaxID=4081 RepID=A0A3Q7ITI3_SOLLC
MGATGTGKSREIEPDSNFTAEDFCLQAVVYIEKIQKTQRVPIIVGGSNSYIEKLVEDPLFLFKYKYDSCFIWIDIEQSILNRRVDMRVDQMVEADYTKGIRRSIGEIEPDSDFTAEDFCLQAVVYIEKIQKTERVPIIIGGSNSYIEKLVEDPVFMFKYKYDSCFIWIDVEQSVLNRKVDMRVDQMVKADAYYTKGIRRSISVPEMDKYFREQTNIDGDDDSKNMILQASISSIKRNTRMLICNQLDKIQRLISEKMWSVHHIIATDVFKEDKEEDTDEAWTNTVLQPCLDIVKLNQIQTSQLKIFKTQRFPIIIGGSNSYIEKLVEDPVFMFKYKYDCCFIWIDVEQSVLNRRVDMRVDQMVKADYTKGIRRSIGVPKRDKYLREETNIDGDDESKNMILQASISSIKRNTRMLICNQLDKIQRLISEKIWSVHHIIATDVFKEDKEEDTDEAWTNTVLQPCLDIGSNSYIEKFVEDPVFMFKYKYDSCFIWIDVEKSILNRRVDMRVDQMVKADYTKGIRRSIGVPKRDKYLREETNIDGDDKSKKMILQASISSIKRNTRMLICNQFIKIQQLISEKMWSVHHIIATDVFEEDKEEDIDEAWTNTLLQPCLDIVKRFLKSDHREIEPHSEFTAEVFCLQAVVYIEKIQKTQRVPFIVGGSNSYIEKLVKDPVFMFKYKYDSCFIWIDVEQSVLNRRVDMRVDQMVKVDYTKGIRRSIGVPEMDKYLREETNIDGDDKSKKMILQALISSIKRNSRMLICNQLDKIQ